jgi:hypothetical protein
MAGQIDAARRLAVGAVGAVGESVEGGEDRASGEDGASAENSESVEGTTHAAGSHATGLEIVPQGGHVLPLEHPDAVDGAIRRVLARVATSSH